MKSNITFKYFSYVPACHVDIPAAVRPPSWRGGWWLAGSLQMRQSPQRPECHGSPQSSSSGLEGIGTTS